MARKKKPDVDTDDLKIDISVEPETLPVMRAAARQAWDGLVPQHPFNSRFKEDRDFLEEFGRAYVAAIADAGVPNEIMAQYFFETSKRERFGGLLVKILRDLSSHGQSD